MKKYKTPMFKPHKLKAGRLLLNGSLGNESYEVSTASYKWDDENDNSEK